MAASFARGIDKRNDWGKWVAVKENALDLLRKKHGKLKDKVIYMSSVTDPINRGTEDQDYTGSD